MDVLTCSSSHTSNSKVIRVITDVISVETTVNNAIFTSIADNITSNNGAITQLKAAGINKYCTCRFMEKLNYDKVVLLLYLPPPA